MSSSTNGGERLPYLLSALKTPRIAERLAQTAERAREEQWPYEQFLETLCEAEVFAREASGARQRTRSAGFPAHKTLEDFDFTAQPSAERPLVMHLAQLAWVEEHANVCPDRPARSGFTLPPSRSSLCKQSSFGLKHLDSQAFATAGGDVHRVSLSALDLVQHGLARDAEAFRGLVERQISVRDVGHELGADLVGQPDPPWRARGDLLAGEQPFAQPATDRRGRHAAAWRPPARSMTVSLSGSGGGATGMPGALPDPLHARRGERQAGAGAPALAVEDRRDLLVGVMHGEPADQVDRVLRRAGSLRRRGGSARRSAGCVRRLPRRSRRRRCSRAGGR